MSVSHTSTTASKPSSASSTHNSDGRAVIVNGILDIHQQRLPTVTGRKVHRLGGWEESEGETRASNATRTSRTVDEREKVCLAGASLRLSPTWCCLLWLSYSSVRPSHTSRLQPSTKPLTTLHTYQRIYGPRCFSRKTKLPHLLLRGMRGTRVQVVPVVPDCPP